jgi:ribonuclease HII
VALHFPGYGLERHVGYGTLAHRQAIRQLGPTRLHRRRFLSATGTSC